MTQPNLNNRFYFIAALVLITVLFWWSLIHLSYVYACLTVAFILAYLLDPLVTSLTKFKLSRGLGSLMVLVVFFIFMSLIVVGVSPKLISQGRELGARLPKIYYSVSHKIGPLSEKYFGHNILVDVDQAVSAINAEPSKLVKPIGTILGRVFSTTFRMISTILGLLIIPLLAYYLLRAFPHIYADLESIIPRRHQKLLSELRTRLHAVFGGFLRGQLVVSLILSFYYFIALSILRLDLALVLGLMAGFFNIIPYLGIATALVLTLFVALIHGAALPIFIAIAGIFTFGMAVEGSILTPKIVGKRVGLGPLALILALLVGGQLKGIVGMLLAVPIAAIAKVFLNVTLAHYRNSVFYKG